MPSNIDFSDINLNELVKGQEWPLLTAFSCKDGSETISFEVSKNVRWFSGHFPEQAVLPGVVQVDWAIKLAKRIYKDLISPQCSFQSISNLKFKDMIFPESTLDLVLSYNSHKNSVKFLYKDSNHTFSTGTLIFNSL